MRRAGQNPTDVEVQDMINKIDNGWDDGDDNDDNYEVQDMINKIEIMLMMRFRTWLTRLIMGEWNSINTTYP